MKEFNIEAVRIETASAVETVLQAQAERQYPAYIGLDVHKETIAVADVSAWPDQLLAHTCMRVTQASGTIISR